jgi:hypothetical protein
VPADTGIGTSGSRIAWSESVNEASGFPRPGASAGYRQPPTSPEMASVGQGRLEMVQPTPGRAGQLASPPATSDCTGEASITVWSAGAETRIRRGLAFSATGMLTVSTPLW